MNVLEFPYIDGMHLGDGLDAITGKVTGSPFKDDSIHVEPKRDNKVERKRSMISTESEYREEIAVAAELHGKGLGWSASGSVSYMKESVKGSTSLVFLDSVVFRDGGEDLAKQSNWKLNDDAEKSLRADPKGFLQQYGTHFVGGFIFGGSYVGKVVIETESSTAVEDLKAALSGAYHGAVNVEGSASFKQKLEETHKKYCIEASSYTEGGTTEKYELGDIDQMIKAADSFANNPKGEERLIAICYPWDYLPCVKQILGNNKLLPEIKEQVRIHLSNVKLRLEYLGASVKHFRDQKLYANESQGDLLKKMDGEISNITQVINDLSITELSKMDVDAALNLVDCDELSKKIGPITRGECTIICECTILDPNWQFCDEQYPPSFMKGNTYTFEITKALPKDEFIQVMAVHSPGKKWMGNFWFKYNLVDASGNPNVSGTRKIRARMYTNHWEKIGDWARSLNEETSKIEWGGISMSARFK